MQRECIVTFPWRHSLHECSTVLFYAYIVYHFCYINQTCIIIMFRRVLTMMFDFLCSFSKFWKATSSLVMSVHPSVRMEQLGCHWRDFHEISCLWIFRKSDEKLQVSLQSDKNNGYFTWRSIYLFLSYLAHFFLEWEMFKTKIVEEFTGKTHILCSVNFFFRKSCRWWENVEKYCRAR